MNVPICLSAAVVNMHLYVRFTHVLSFVSIMKTPGLHVR